YDVGNAIITSLGNVKGNDVKNAVNPSFTEYDTLVRQKNITIQISLDFKVTPPSDAAKRGGTVITELYAQLQLDKLAAAGYFTDY
ncbi:MAG TPA: hypothetical protein PK530_24880, partial [Anaerolineales bacterium]|nr:hypothetical protein [Anaerolineales bacterium]